MDFIRLSITRPVGVAVGVILAVMFGLIGLGQIPIQLTPTVDRPQITISTSWPGRSPQEIVDEITRPQEEELKNVGGLKHMSSVSRQDQSEITLEFLLGTDIARALQEVSDALRQVSSYPDEVEEPTIKVASSASEDAIAWIMIDLPEEKMAEHPGFDITTLYDDLDDEVKPALERVPGVAEVNIYGGREREARVLVDPVKLAQRKLTYGDVVRALRGENRNVSAGTIAEGKREYRVRVQGEFQSPEDILATIIEYRDGMPVYVHDVAEADVGYQKKSGFIRTLGHPSIAINILRQADANVVRVMSGVRKALEDIRVSVLPNIGGVVNGKAVGPDLRMRQVYDETVYIDSAIGLVISNLYVGGAIAGVVLLLFLRAIRPTLVILLAIPISVICTFLVMWMMGRTLNVISLAGLAFAVGMVVDNGIVVLENVYRKMEEGHGPLQAAYLGAKEVWGAVLASTLTTAAVFIPVLTIQEEVGQLFRDLSIAIVTSVTLSLIVSITVIPAACRWMTMRPPRTRLGRMWERLFGVAWIFEAGNRGLRLLVKWCITGWRGATVRPAVIVVMTVASLILSVKLMPPLDYLPAGNRNLVFGGLQIPPGLSLEQKEKIAETIESQIRPYADAKISDPASVAALAPIPRFDAPDHPFAPVPVGDFFVGAFRGGIFIGATSQDEQVVLPVGTLLTNAMSTIPDSYGGARQTSLFGRGVGGGNSINLEISGPDLDKVTAAAGYMFNVAAQMYGFGSVQADPSNFNLQEQEFQIRLNARGRELGLSTEDLGVAARALFDGAYVGEYKLGSDTIDMVLMPPGGRLDYKEQIADIPVATPSGRVVPIDSVVEFVPSLAPQEIHRIEELPSVVVRVQPPQGQALQTVMESLKEKVIGGASDAGLIDRTMRVRLEGTAAKLDEVQTAMFGQSTGKAWISMRGAWLIIIASLAIGGVFAGVCLARVRRGWRTIYGAIGCVLTAGLLGALVAFVAVRPELLEARFVWALVVTYLLMAALFESFVYPFVIMFTVPLAIVGGFAGLAIVHSVSLADPTKPPQQLDVLTMLGFFILIGVVVNTAILLVHQAQNFMREEGLSASDAIAQSVQSRVRPIFMSVLTSVGGMLPLVIAPGAGSEMYRGLGSVVVGGLMVSTVFTLLLVPLLYSLVLEMREGIVLALSRPVASGTEAPTKPILPQPEAEREPVQV